MNNIVKPNQIKIYSAKEVEDILEEACTILNMFTYCDDAAETFTVHPDGSDEGEIFISTKIYKWSDGTYRNIKEEKLKVPQNDNDGDHINYLNLAEKLKELTEALKIMNTKE